MTGIEYFKKYGKKVAPVFLLIFLLFYMIYHLIGSSSDGLLTTPVREVTDYTVYAGTGYLFREETVLTVQDDKLILPLAKDGEKVGKGVAVAAAYPTDAASKSEKQSRLDALNRKIALLEESLRASGKSVSELDAYRKEEQNALLSVKNSLLRKDLSGITDDADNLLSAGDSVNLLTGQGLDPEELLNACKEERDALLSGTGETIGNDKSSGYFYDHASVDGYESRFSIAALERLTGESFSQLIKAPVTIYSGTVAGKIVYDYRWTVAVELDSGVAEKVEVGKTYPVRFPENRDAEFLMSCDRVLDGENGTVILLLSSNENPTDFVFLRAQALELLTENCEGFYLPASAVRTHSGNEGVFVFETGTVSFRKIEVLFRGDGYVIAAKPNGSEDGFLGKNELVVTSGNNLYDGKVYR